MNIQQPLILLQSQEYHRDILINLLIKNGRAIDYSPTGCGKTIVSLSVYRELKLLDTDNELMRLNIICPPSLTNHWKIHCDRYNISAVFHSMCSIKPHLFEEDGFIIVDEYHNYKNNKTLRYQRLSRVVSISKYILFISATPIDRINQYHGMKQLVQFKSSHKMNITHDYQVKCILTHCALRKDETKENTENTEDTEDNENTEDTETVNNVKLYKTGLSYIGASVRPNDIEMIFNPGLFMKGIMNIHDSLYPELVEYMQFSITKYKNYKHIIIMHFEKHFNALKSLYPDVPILNGKMTIHQRNIIIKKFQENNNELSIIAISDGVGSEGIELDDKYGTYPRHIIMLPTTNGIVFKQIIGRVLRINTKSNSLISIIQPNFDETYFKKQMITKLSVIKLFNQVPYFKYKIHKHNKECSINVLNTTKILFDCFPLDIVKHIAKYTCSCLTKMNVNTLISTTYDSHLTALDIT